MIRLSLSSGNLGPHILAPTYWPLQGFPSSQPNTLVWEVTGLQPGPRCQRMDQTPISTPDQRKPRKEKAGQTGVDGDLINSIKGNKSIMRGRPKGQQVVTIVT